MFKGTHVFYFRLFSRVVFEPRPYEWGESVILHFGWKFTLWYEDEDDAYTGEWYEEKKRLIRENDMRKRKGLYRRMNEDVDYFGENQVS